MPNYQAMAAAAAQKYGVPVPVFLRQISQESGFNPGARSGAGALGIAQFMPSTAASMGVNPMDPASALDGAARLDAQNIKKYGSIARALSAYNSGRPDAYLDPKFAGGQTYNYVRSIMGGKTPAVPKASKQSGMGLVGASSMAPQANTLAAAMLEQAGLTAQGLDGGQSLLDMAMARQQAGATQDVYGPAQSTAPSAGPVKGFKPGSPVADMTSVGGEHPTEGLAGYPARDYFAPAGSPAVAPVTGKVIRLSGHDPSMGPIDGPHGPLGWSVYIQGNDGHIYYLTHMGSRNVQVGATVRAGQPIGTVADYAKYGTPSHIHMGVH